MAVIWKWKLMDLVRTIVCTLLNKYDFVVAVDGGTGKGKRVRKPFHGGG